MISTANALRRLLSLGLTVILVLTLTGGALAATASASDMRLVSTTGTVTLKNASGKTLSVRDNMKLYSGYTVSTAAKSYAYISLDSTKAVKLDAGTKVEVRKDGNKLELLVSSGQLFFNVTAPLSSSESLNIRTSTMVTGIRGTSGYVNAGDGLNSTVTILDGQVTASTADATVTVRAGQTGSTTLTDSVGWQVTTSTVTETGIPGFVAVELAADTDLQQRVAADTDLDVANITAGAQDRLEADQQQAQAAQDQMDLAASALSGSVSQAPEFGASTPVTGSSGGAGSTPAPDPGGETPDSGDSGSQEPDGAYRIQADTTAADLQNMLNTQYTVDVVVGAGITLTIDASVTFSVGQSLTVESGAKLVITADGSLANYDEIRNDGTMENAGYIHNFGTFINNGAFTNSAGGKLENMSSQYSTASITNTGTITNTGKITNYDNAAITNNGTITNNTGATITNDGTYSGTAPDGSGTLNGNNAISPGGSSEAEGQP